MALDGFTIGSGGSSGSAPAPTTAPTNTGGALKGFTIGAPAPTVPKPVSISSVPAVPTPVSTSPSISPSTQSLVDTTKTPDTSGLFNNFLSGFSFPTSHMSTAASTPSTNIAPVTPVLSGTLLPNDSNGLNPIQKAELNQQTKVYNDAKNAGIDLGAPSDPTKLGMADPTSVKYPFMSGGFYLPGGTGPLGNPLSQAIKGTVEWPERVGQILSDAVAAVQNKPLPSQQPNVQNQEFTVDSVATNFQNTHDALVAQGASETYANWVATIGSFSAGILDLTPLAGELDGAAHSLARGSVPSTEAHVAAFKLLGSPKDEAALQANYRTAIKLTHPDLAGVTSDELAKSVNNAYTILKKEGLPSASTATSKIADALIKPHSFNDLANSFKKAAVGEAAPDGFSWAGTSRQLGDGTETAHGQLSTQLQAEIKDAIQTHGESATHAALQENMGMTPYEATKAIDSITPSDAVSVLHDTVTPPVKALKSFDLNSDITPQTAKEYIAGLNKATSDKISAETSAKALSGQLEDKRVTDTGTRKVYRANNNPIQPGDFVTDSEARVAAYQTLRDGAPIQTKEIPATDLVKGARGGEYIYAPKASNETSITNPEAHSAAMAEVSKYKNSEDFLKQVTFAEDRGVTRKAIDFDKMAVPTDKLKLKVDSNNPKIDESTVAHYKEEIQNGRRPALITDGNNIIDGHHKLMAYEELGHMDVPTVQKSSIEDFYHKMMNSKNTFTPPMRGYINPGAIAEPIVDAAKQVVEYVEHAEKTTVLTGTVNEAIYQHEGSRKAMRQRAIQLLQAKGSELTAEQWERLYHYDENPNEETLTKRELEIYKEVIGPLKQALTKAREEYRAMGGHITSDLQEEEAMTPRYAKEKGGPLDKAITQTKEGTKQAIGVANGGLLSKSVGSGAKHRVFHAAIDEEGNRHVISIKSNRVTAFNKGTLTDLGELKTVKREKLLKNEIHPLQKKIRSISRLINTLDSVKTRNPVSAKRLANLEARIDALKEFVAERRVKINPTEKIHKTFTKEIDKTNAEIAKLETQLSALKKFGNIPRVAKELDKLQTDIGAAYDHESNIALSDIYENLSEFVDRNNEIEDKLIKDLSKTTTEFKILSKVRKAEDVVLTVARIKNAKEKIQELSDQIGEIEQKYDPEKLVERVFKGSDNKVYKVTQATTKEIEAHTKTRYHKNVLANYVLAFDRTNNALSALKLLERIKNTPEFGDIIVKEDPEVAPPAGWQLLTLPQFRGYYAEPKLWEALQDLSSRLAGREAFPVVDEINNLLTSLIVLNPIMHFPNVLQGWATAEAADGKIPGVSKNSAKNFARAFNAVKNKDELYLSYLEHGAPLMALKNTASEFTKAVLEQYSSEVETNPTQWQELSKKLGYANPAVWFKGLMHLNETATWGGNDIMFLHAILDASDREGVTPEVAIKLVSKRMADYRMPSRIGPGKFGRAVSKLAQSRVLLFARYHYSGVIKPWIESIGDAAGPKSSWKQRREGLRALTYLGLMALVVYPFIDKLLQGVTGNPLTYISDAGPTKLVQNVQKLAKAGAPGTPAFLASMFTPSPAVTAAIELGFNVDLYTRNPIYSNPQNEGLGGFTTSMISPMAGASRMTPSDFALSLLGIYSPKNAPGKNALNAQKYDELPLLQAQVKKDIIAGNTAKANAEMKDYNDRAIANYNAAMLATGKKPLPPDGSENEAFLKVWGVKAPGQKALSDAAKLYGDGSLTSKSSLVDRVATYSKALGVDPVETFHLLFTGQQIVKVDNFSFFGPDSAIIVQRMSLAESSKIKDGEASAQGDTTQNGLQLDHIIPLEAGGTNDKSNLNLISTDQDGGDQQKLEDVLGKAVKAGTISRAHAREYAIRFKASVPGEALPQAMMDEFTNKYGGKAITLAEVQDLITKGKAK